MKESAPSANLLKNGKEGVMINKDTVTGFGMGFLAGAAIGVALGFLFAPRPGRETRELIREKAEDWRERVEDWMERMEEKIEERVEERVEAVKKGRADKARKAVERQAG